MFKFFFIFILECSTLSVELNFIIIIFSQIGKFDWFNYGLILAIMKQNLVIFWSTKSLTCHALNF